MATFASYDFLQVSRRGGSLVDVVLDRPKKLNALDLAMVRECADAVGKTVDLAAEGRCVAMALRGAGGKAFCAGGDVAAVRSAGLAGAPPDGSEPLYSRFFREEYVLNSRLGALGRAGARVKQVSVWDGIVMGGGVGLSVHGRFRVATERSVFAMPEVAIGLFPDVGAAHALARMPGGTGAYAALTGLRLGPADLLSTGLATHYVPSGDVDALLAALAELDEALAPDAFDAAVADALEAAGHGAAPPEPSALDANKALIAGAFEDATSLDAVLAALDGDGSAFAASAAKAMRRGSPTSVAISLELIRRAKGATLDDCLKTDFRVVSRVVAPRVPPSDFYEGVRAALVDKDRSPAWHPAPEDVAAYFEPLDGEKELDL